MKHICIVIGFLDMAAEERTAIDIAIKAALNHLVHSCISHVHIGVSPLKIDKKTDVIIYLGESSRYHTIIQAYEHVIPSVLVKSTMNHLLSESASKTPKYRMCATLTELIRGLVKNNEMSQYVDFRIMDWGEMTDDISAMDNAEKTFVDNSLDTLQAIILENSLTWLTQVPNNDFCLFLPMHEPLVSRMAAYAIGKWPRAHVFSGDGMTSTHRPNGESWGPRLKFIRHWSSQLNTPDVKKIEPFCQSPIPDSDSLGLLFNTILSIDSLACYDLKKLNGHWFQGPFVQSRFNDNGEITPKKAVVIHQENARLVSI